MSTRIIIADDHAIVRRGLRDLLNHHFRPERLVEVTSCAGLTKALQRGAVDLLILDLELDDGSSLDLVEQVHRKFPAMPILVYTTGPERLYANRAFALGSAGFVHKQSSEDDVVLAVRRLLQGKQYHSHEFQLDRRVEKRLLMTDSDPFSSLSQREISVMNELLRGSAVKDIAEHLGLRPTTAATYKARLFDKLRVSNMLDLQRLVDAHKRG